MAIDFIPFEELFAPAYQLTYISTDGHIDVGPYTYSVFHYYTMTERQVIFQVCEKHLPWEYTQEQEQWERTQYMYQFIIKSPPPFPYEEYPLSEDIIMAITWEVKITVLNKEEKRASITATRIDSTDPENIKKWSVTTNTIISTVEQKLATLDFIWGRYQKYLAEQNAIDEIIGELESQAKENLEAREI